MEQRDQSISPGYDNIVLSRTRTIVKSGRAYTYICTRDVYTYTLRYYDYDCYYHRAEVTTRDDSFFPANSRSVLQQQRFRFLYYYTLRASALYSRTPHGQSACTHFLCIMSAHNSLTRLIQ